MADPFGSSPVSNSSFLNNGLPSWQEFVKYYNANKGIVNHPLANHPTAIRYDRVLPNDQYLDNMPWQYTPQSGRQFSYWEYPQRVARYYDMIRAASPDWKPPEWLDVNKVNEAYDYLKYRNEGRPTQEWKALPADDPGTQLLQGMGRPPIQYLMPSEITYSDLVQTQEQVDAQKPIDWSEFDEPGKRWVKLYLTMFSPQSEGITGRPESSKLAASIGQALLPSLGVGAALGAVTYNPLVGAIGTVASTALLAYQNYTGNQIPGLNAIMRPFNYMAEAAESTIGNIALGSEYGLKEVFDDPEAAYRAGLLNYETMKMSNIPNWFAKTADFFNPMDVTTAGKDEIWKISSGILEPVKAPHGKGAEALKYYHDWIQTGKALDEYDAAINEGNFTGRYQDYIYQKAMSEYGDTAIANDMVFQTVLDPLNVMPWAVGKTGSATAAKIAKTAKDPATVRMAATWSEILKQGTGNVMIDALPIGLQQLVSGITKAAPSRGILDNLGVYRDWIRNYTFPKSLMDAGADMRVKYESLVKEGIDQASIKQVDDTLVWKDKNGIEQVYKAKEGIKIEIPKIEDLSPLEKFIGGIDDTYGLKELRPTVGKKFLTKFVSLTPDAQVSHILTAFHHNIATLMDSAGGDPARMTDLIQKLSGRVEVKPGELGYDMINSPANKAVMAAMRWAFKDGDIAGNELGRWLSGGERRSILEKVAGALNEKVADVLTQLQDDPDTMAARLNKIAPELNTTGKDLTTTLKVFIGEDAMPWSAEQFQARLVNAIATKMDDFFVEKYGLKQDSWVFRASNAMKGVQSLVLLGFNPAYFMNNWVNNVVTRAADGIGGYMTNKQINEFYTRFGIFPKDSGLSMYDDITGAVIRNAQEASNDVLSKAQKTITFLNKAGVFSRLSHKIEKLEGGQARVIAMNQYLDKTKKVGQGIRKLDIATEIMLDNRYPGLKERIYNAVNAGMNMKEIEQSLFSTEIRPHIENIIDDIETKYPGARDILRKTNLTDRLRDELSKVKTQEDMELAFENVKNAWEGWVDEQTSKAIIHEAEQAKNITDAERVPFVLHTFGNMILDQAKRWLNGRKEWDDLYGQEGDLRYSGMWDTQVKKLERKQRAEWERARKFEVQTHEGIIRSIGIENEHSRAYVNGIGEYHDTWNTYWKERGKLYDEYYSYRRGKDQTTQEFYAEKQRMWDKLQDAQDKLYDDATSKEMEIQRRMDAEFAAMYESYTGWDATTAAKWRADLWNMRKQIVDQQKAMRKRTKGMTPEERAQAYKDFNPGYNKLIADMHQFEHDGAYKLMKKPVPQNKVEIPQPAIPEIGGVQGALREETANLGFNDEQLDRLYPRQAAEAVNQARKQAEQAKNQQLEKVKTLVKAKITAEDIYSQADQAKRQALIHDNGMLARSDVEDGFITAFPMAERGQVTVAMTLIDQFIDTWAKRNGLVPSEAVRDAWYATRIGSIERGDGTVAKGALEKLDQLMQTEQQARIINTPEFKKWFGNSKVVDENGKPLVMYHGTSYDFSEFSNLKKDPYALFGPGFYFTDNTDVSSGYAFPNSGFFTEGANVKPVYLKIENPLNMDKALPDGLHDKISSIMLNGPLKEYWSKFEIPYSRNGAELFNNIIDSLPIKYKNRREMAIEVLKEAGFDGITHIGGGRWNNNDGIRHRVYIAFSPEQIKSVFNEGTFDPNNPNILKQGITPKGSYKLMDDGKAIIKGFQQGDISSMVHEVAHVFRRDLPEADLDIVAQHGGLVNGTELRELEAAFMSGQLKEGTPEYDKYVAAEEQFARGWERYLAEGDAPTPQLKGIFRQFTDWMLNIYKSLRKVANKLTGVESTPLNVDITAKVNGQSLKDVFDRMLTDKVDRIPTYDSLVSNKFTEVKQTGRNHRFSDADLTTMAHKELIADILGRYDSEDAARKALTDMQDFEYLKDGTQIDDATINDALKYAAEHPEVNPWNKAKAPEVRAVKKTFAHGVKDHEQKYGMTFKVVSLDDLIASDNIQGANLIPNPNFPQAVQNRITATGTGELSNRMSWVIDTAGKLAPDELLYDSRSAQIGSPIVGSENVVASGNGRVAVLQYARENFPDKWQEYQSELPKNAAEWGIKPEDIANIKDPVLVRELDPDIDLVEFANDTNKPTVAVMTPVEIAMNDANNITTAMLKRLSVLENEDIYQSLQQPRNNGFVNSFIDTLTSNEKSGITTDNKINQAGIERIVNALISKVYNTADGEAMLDTFRNSTDNNIKTLQSAIMASLPQMATIEGLIKNGERAASLSLADDVAFAANKISSLRDQGMSAGEFLGQMGLFGEGEAANLTPSQKILLSLFDAKTPKKIRETLRNYAGLVERQPAEGQATVTNLTNTKEDMLNEAIRRTEKPGAEQGSIFGQRPDAGTAESIQGNELARPETAGEVQPIPAGNESIPGMVEPIQGAGQPVNSIGEYGFHQVGFYPDSKTRDVAAAIRDGVSPSENSGLIFLRPESSFEMFANIPEAKNTVVVKIPEGLNILTVKSKDALAQALGWKSSTEMGSTDVPAVAKAVGERLKENGYDGFQRTDFPEVAILSNRNLDVVGNISEFDNIKRLTNQPSPAVRQPWEMSQYAYGDSRGVILNNRTVKSLERELNTWKKRLDLPDISKENVENAIRNIESQLAVAKEHKAAIEQALAEGKAVPREVLFDYPDLVAKQVITTETKADYDAGKPVPIEKAEGIDLTHQDTLPVPDEVQRIINTADNLRFAKKKQAKDYLAWVIDGEKDAQPSVAQDVIDYYADRLDFLRDYAAKKASGLSIDTDKFGIYNEHVEGPTNKQLNDAAASHLSDLPTDLLKKIFTKAHEGATQEGTDTSFHMWKPYWRDASNLHVWLRDNMGKDPNITLQSNGYKYSSDAGNIVLETPTKKGESFNIVYNASTERVAKNIVNVAQPGINIQKVYTFKHGDTDIVANVYKNGELIAYMPAVPLKDAQLEDGVRILGLDPQFPDKWVYEQDGVIKSVDSKKPEIEKPQTASTNYNRAPAGGIIGMNGEFYPGGTFLPNTTMPKLTPEQRKTNKFLSAKQEIAPFTWELPPSENVVSIYRILGGALPFDKKTSQFRYDTVSQNTIEYLGGTTRVKELVDAYNKGAKWLDKSVDMRKPEVEKPVEQTAQPTTQLTKKKIDSKWTSYSDESGQNYYEIGYHHVRAGNKIAYNTYSVNYADPSQGGKMVDLGEINNKAFNTRQEAEDFIYQHHNQQNKTIPGTEGQSSLFQSGQLDMFSQTAEDLPLFSGTPMSAEDMGFAPKAASPQMSLFPDVVPEAKPTRIIEIAIKEKGSTAYVRLDLKKTKAIRDTLALHKGAEMTARILDANGKVMESNLNPQQVVNPTFGGNALFQAAENTSTPEFYNWWTWDWKNNRPGNKPSAVVDENGKPMSVFHGTGEDIEQFDKALRGSTTGAPSAEKGFFFTKSRKVAEGYAEYARPKYIIDLNNKQQQLEKIAQRSGSNSDWDKYYRAYEKYEQAELDYVRDNDRTPSVIEAHLSMNNPLEYDFKGEPYREVSYNDLVQKAIENGNDGVILRNTYDAVDEWHDEITDIFVVFNSEQVKSTSNSGAYDPKNANILKQQGFAESDGATEQFREYNAPPIDVQREMDAPMGKVPLNGTPTTEPFAQTLNEVTGDYINPILTDIQSAFKAKMGDKAFSWGDVSDADRKTVRQYLNGTVTNDLADVKRAALTYGDTMRNNAMLDYSRRFGFDNYLNLIFPYQFWYTRSMMNWAKRAIDKPSWFAMYARIQQAQERMEREGMPTRLRGKVRFDQPWMPEWMGGGLWTDPLNKLFPFDQFGQPFEQYSSNQNQVMKRAEQIIDDMRTSEKITSDDARQALETQSGSVWDRAVSQAELELDKSASPLSLATMMMTPALWWTVPYNIAKGTPEKISTLPITRTGQTMKELGRDTFIEPMTDLVGGIMAGGETAIRKKAGLSEFGQWGDYYIDRTLAGMAADGEITAEQARIAMIQRSGDAFAEAYRRVQTEQALRTPGAAGLMALKETVKNKEGIGTVAGQTLSGFLAGMFGGGLFSEGELKMRGLKPEYDNAWRKFEAGDEEAINDFFDNHPEYYARLALYDEPETRLHQFLIDSIWKKYMDLDVENRRLAREALGDEFLNSFLNKETRSYDAVSDETLARWSQTLGKSEMPEQVANVQGGQVEYYDQAMVQAITIYKAEKERQFPNIAMWQEQYYALPAGAQRKAFLNQYPQLKAYWDWKDAYADQHPEIVPYFDELKNKATADEVTSEMTNPLIRSLLAYATGGSLTSGAKSEIERIRQMYAPDMDEEEFLALLMSLVAP
jgi:soluble cytochrome b562